MPDNREEALAAFTLLTETVDGGTLRQLFQIIVGEIFIRSHDDDDFIDVWEGISTAVTEMFNPETTPHKEVLQGYIDARTALLELKSRRFENVEMSSPTSPAKQYGHLSVAPDSEDAPGQYL